MDSPARQRLAQVSPDGYIAQSGVASFRRRLIIIILSMNIYNICHKFF